MPDNLWSKTYAQGDEWQTQAVYRPFVRAINERVKSVDPTFATFSLFAEDLAGQSALEVSLTSPGWAKMQWTVNELADLYVDPDVDPEGGDYSTFFRPPLSARPAWPGANGWTRKREREINSIAAAGTDGQRARYVYLHGVSPIGEREQGTKLFDRVGGMWVLSTDQTTSPDTVTSYGLAQSGDLFGPWILNDLRDAINDLWITPLNPYVYQQSVSSSDAPTSPVDGAGFHVHTEYAVSNSGPDLAAALAAGTDTVCDLAEADLATAGTWTVDGTKGTYYFVFVSGSNTDPRWFTCYAKIEYVMSKPAVADVPDHCLSVIDWYLGAKKPTDYSQYVESFHDDGTGLIENQFHKFGETSSAAAVGGEIQGPELGSLAAPPTRPVMTVTSAGFNGKLLGYGDPGVAALAYARWNVPGGFEYTADSP